MANYYRVMAGNIGIYEAVDKECPRGDSRRFDKPDGGWLPKVGPNYPDGISYWTETGMKKYYECGLLDWHASVVDEDVYVVISEKPSKIFYTDDYQVICDPATVHMKKKLPLRDFIIEFLSY